jgi:hypothetical protein
LGDDARSLEIRLPFSKTEIHLYLPAEFFFDRSPAGRICPLDSTLDVVRVVEKVSWNSISIWHETSNKPLWADPSFLVIPEP